MNLCICCHDRLIRHLKHQRVYWFCSSCYQEMPSIYIYEPTTYYALEGSWEQMVKPGKDAKLEAEKKKLL